MQQTVFDFSDYKAYLSTRLSTDGENRGLRTKLAKKINCQPAFISQVLNSYTHFSLEHSILIDDFLSHNADESEYFILLVHQARAGNQGLRQYYDLKMKEIKEGQKIISNRIKIKEKLSQEDAYIYYSTWYYSAIHVILMIPKYQTAPAISEYLKMPLGVVNNVLDFLVKKGLVVFEKNKFQTTSNRIHLGKDSVLTNKYHSSYRIRSIQALEENNKQDLHYTHVLALSENNAEKLRSLIVNFIESIEPIVAEPNEETLCALTLDYFKL